MSRPILAIVFATSLGAVAVAAPAEAAPITPSQTQAIAEVQVLPDDALAPPARTGNDAERYAQRELKAQAQQDFRGGNMIVVGLSTTAAIVILVLLLLLI